MHLLHSGIAEPSIVQLQQSPIFLSSGTARGRTGAAQDAAIRKTEVNDMAYATQHTAAHGITTRLAAVAADIADRIARRRVYRRTLNELTRLTGRELADLGLHRSQLNQVAYEAAYAR